jgi:hypothetical protein
VSFDKIIPKSINRNLAIFTMLVFRDLGNTLHTKKHKEVT